jgi:phosphoglycerate dehydrogenase-like enzyme
MKKILIQTNTYFTKDSWLCIFDENLDKEHYKHYKVEFAESKTEMLHKLPKANVCFSFSLPEFEKVKHLELLYLGISGINYLDKFNIPKEFNLKTSKGISSNIIAEHTLLMALSLIRKFPNAILNQKKRKWDQSIYIKAMVRSIRDYNIGIIGMGNNGKAIAEIFGNIGCNVLGYSNNKVECEYVNNWYLKRDLNKFLKDSEIIIIALPLRSDTFHFINKEKLLSMGEETMIINIARGEIINENELINALKNSDIKAAALDVFEKEPLSRWSQLWKLPNLIITPHIAGNIHFIKSEIQVNFLNIFSIGNKKNIS